jgi:Flp pilus assembly protein TadG
MIPRGQRGSALAEFGIVSIAALTLMFGMVDFGRALYMYHLVAEVARQTVRYAIVNGAAACPGGNPSPDPLQSFADTQAPLVGSGSLSVTTSCAGSTLCASGSSTNCSNTGGCTASPYNSAGCLVTVEVDYAFHFLVPMVSQLTLPMTSTSTMVIAQ